MFRLMILLMLAGGAYAEVPHVNWENHPVHPLDLSPDGRLLAVAHTADARVQLFDVSQGRPTPVGHVVVGVDPVAVRFRSDDELWVVNHISDSVSIIDVPDRRIRLTIATADEPYDVVFAGTPEHAFVSSSQTNTVQRFSVSNPQGAPTTIEIVGEEPRALAVSPDRRHVYAAIFESGNGTTVLSGATAVGATPPNAVNRRESPYGGQNPPPNAGDAFSPAQAPGNPTPPRVGLIVRRDETGRWWDDNGGDWTDFVSGGAASASGRVTGWDLADHDLAIIDANTLNVSYRRGLMTTGMALAVNPATGEPTLVGTEARNQIRFEPNANGVFLEVRLAQVPSSGNARIADLNPHLDYSASTVAPTIRAMSIGDPRGITWHQDGELGYVTGMGSNNVVMIDRQGRAASKPIDVGQGPIGLQLSADERWLFVWNHFEASLSTVDVDESIEVARTAVFNPLPAAIREGRPAFYDTHATSGLGQLACAGCHIDARTDGLAWDLGDPSGAVKAFNQNCGNSNLLTCGDFHPMKGPMLTQTLQDIIGKEPFHWRGDRDGLEEFNGAFTSLQGNDRELSDLQMQQFKGFLATVTLPPNPHRNLDNTLSSQVELLGQFTSGRFATAGQPLGTGDALRGLDLFTTGAMFRTPTGFGTNCTTCHSLPTGMGINGTLEDVVAGTVLGGRVLPPGPNGENHLAVMAMSTNQGRTMKVPQLRTLYERTGFDLRTTDGTSGFGFLHDGTVATLSDMLTVSDFLPESDRDVADLMAFLLSFSGSDLPEGNPAITVAPPNSQDSHAATGQQATLVGAASSRFDQLLTIARTGAVDLVAHGMEARPVSWAYDRGQDRFLKDDGRPGVSPAALAAEATPDSPIMVMAMPAGLGTRLGIDRDGDGIANEVEFDQGSDPADPGSTTFAPVAGLWYNPDRAGHGIDLQRAGDLLAATWYTYEDDGTPTWYQSVARFQGRSWSAGLVRYESVDDGVEGQTLGTMSFDFTDARRAEFCWTLDSRSGCEPFERFQFASGLPAADRTGLWFDPLEPGYGLSVDTLGDVRVAVVYFYDSENQPRWVIGQDANSRSGEIAMQSIRGFCPDCPTTATSAVDSGAATVVFEFDAREFALDLDVQHDGGPTDNWVRQGVTMVPLTDKPVNYGR